MARALDSWFVSENGTYADRAGFHLFDKYVKQTPSRNYMAIRTTMGTRLYNYLGLK